MRALSFNSSEAKSQHFFEMLYSSIILGGGNVPRSITTIRQEARLLDSLDAISLPDATLGKIADGAEGRRVMSGAVAYFKDEDLAALMKRVEDTPWRPLWARDVIALLDWMEATPQAAEEMHVTT